MFNMTKPDLRSAQGLDGLTQTGQRLHDFLRPMGSLMTRSHGLSGVDACRLVGCLLGKQEIDLNHNLACLLLQQGENLASGK